MYVPSRLCHGDRPSAHINASLSACVRAENHALSVLQVGVFLAYTSLLVDQLYGDYGDWKRLDAHVTPLYFFNIWACLS